MLLPYMGNKFHSFVVRFAHDVFCENRRLSEASILYMYFYFMRLIQRSARAVMVRLGLTPTLAETADPSTTYRPG